MREFGAMNNINTLFNQHQISSLQEIHHHQQMFDPASSHDDFLQQMLSSVPSSAAAAFPWAEDHSPPPQMEEQSAAALASKLRQQQISSGAAKALMLQQQLLLSRGFAAGNGLRSPAGIDGGGLPPMPQVDHNDVVDGNSFNSAYTVSFLFFDLSTLSLYMRFTVN